MRKLTPSTSRRSVGLFVLASLLCGVAVGGFVSVQLRQSTSPFATPARLESPQLVPVGKRESVQSVPATVEVIVGESVGLSSGPVNGRVTAVKLAGDDQNLTLEIDGIERPLLRSESPLWRRLRWGQSGTDVDAVDELLSDLGYPSREPGVEARVDSGFVSAVRRFETDYGWPKSGIFETHYVIWASPEWSGPARLAVSVGELIGPESPLALDSLVVIQAVVTPRDPEAGIDYRNEERQFRVLDGPTLQISPDGHIEESAFDQVLDIATMDQTGEVSIDGVIELTKSVDLQTVPTSAIVIGRDGATCVVLADQSVEAVDVIGGRGGVTEIVSSLSPSASTVANPAESAAQQCNS